MEALGPDLHVGLGFRSVVGKSGLGTPSNPSFSLERLLYKFGKMHHERRVVNVWDLRFPEMWKMVVLVLNSRDFFKENIL